MKKLLLFILSLVVISGCKEKGESRYYTYSYKIDLELFTSTDTVNHTITGKVSTRTYKVPDQNWKGLSVSNIDSDIVIYENYSPAYSQYLRSEKIKNISMGVPCKINSSEFKLEKFYKE